MDEPTGREILDSLLDFRDFVHAGFEQMRSEMNARFEQTGVRFSGIEVRLDRVERRLTNLETRVDDGFTRMDERLGKLEALGS